MKRLLVVYNPNSSQFIYVKDEVLSRVAKIKGIMVGKFTIEKTNFESNVARLAKALEDEDFVLAAGGDATAAIAANAIMDSKKDVTFAVLPYGNFNDLARTLGTMKYEDIFRQADFTKVVGSAQREANSSHLYPLDIIVDGKHWRYATCYVTIGMTAEAVELFDDKKVRKYLQKGHKSSWRSYVYLAKWYFKNRHKKQFIPDFKLNGKLQPKKTTDYAAVSGRSMCRVMKGGYDYRVPKKFRSMTDRLANFCRLSKLMAKSIFIRTPGYETEGDILEFVNPATVELQAEGEYQVFRNVKIIEIKKASKFLKVIENRRERHGKQPRPHQDR